MLALTDESLARIAIAATADAHHPTSVQKGGLGARTTWCSFDH
jgi:hypothetical protein